MNDPLEKAVQTIINVAAPDKIILFGSRAGTDYSKESDYDLMVLKKNVKHARKLAQEIYLNFKNIGAPVDVIVVDYAKFEKLKDDPYMIYYEAAKYGKEIYSS